MTAATALTKHAQSRAILPSRLHAMHRSVLQAGSEVIGLHIGEPHLGVPGGVRDAFVEAIRRGDSTYCDAPGLPRLREALSARLAQLRRGHYSPDRIFVTPGSCQALAATLLSIATPGGSFLLPEIHWPMHLQQVQMAGLVPRFYTLTGVGLTTADALSHVDTRGACGMLVCSPSNPDGAVHDPEDIKAIYAWAAGRGLPIISDNAYEDFIYEGRAAPIAHLERDLPDAMRIVYSVHTFSKSYSMTGYRLGYVCAPSLDRAALLSRVQEAMLVAPATPPQFAGIAALADDDHVQSHRAYVEETRNEVFRSLQGSGLLPKPPAGGWYALLDLSPYCRDSSSLCSELLESAGVALAPGAAFAPPGHLKAATLARMALCRERNYTLDGISRLLRFLRRQGGTHV